MKNHSEKFAVRVLTLAVHGALAVMFATPFVAQAQDDVVAAMKRPDNFVEIGVSGVNEASGKFGEYNGLKKSGGTFIGNFNVRGGNAYDGTGTLRYELSGTDLGTTSREIGATIGEQGRWKLKFGYDELEHVISDTYQTPYLEKMGGNTFTLPAAFGYIDTTRTTLTPTGDGQVPGAAWVAGNRNMTAAQQGAFHTEEISSSRKNTSFGAGFTFNRQWSVSLDLNRLERSGAKLLGVATQSYSLVSAPSATATPAATATWKNQGSILAMSPTNYNTNSINLALNFVGEQGHLTAGYYGSFFDDGYNSFSVMSPMAGASAGTTALTATCAAGVSCYPTNTMSTAPTNYLNQFNLTGGYAFSGKTKLAGGFSYGRNVQNDSFISDPMMALNPSGESLNGLVITRNASLKLTDQSFKDLTLTAGVKYNERDNQTASNLYKFYSINLAKTVVVPSGAGSQVVVNAPFSNEKVQLELAGDYRLAKGQMLHVGYERENYSRWCSSVAANPTPFNKNANGFPAAPADANCVLAATSKEDKLSLGYRMKTGNDVSFGVGYAYNKRNSDYDPTYFNTVLGIHGSEVYGFRQFFEASRTQNMLKANISLQANEKLSLSANAKYAKDSYPDSQLGDQGGKTRGVNLDASYSYSDKGSFSAFLSWQDKNKEGLLSNNGSKSPWVTPLVVPTALWFNRQTDSDNTVGVSASQKGLMGGKLTVSGDLTLSHNITTQKVDDAGLNTIKTAVNLCQLSNIGLCGSYPDVDTKVAQLKLVGNYAVDKRSKVAVTYLYQKLSSSDYYFNGYQYGYTASAQLPTNEESPNYRVQAIGVTYNYSF